MDTKTLETKLRKEGLTEEEIKERLMPLPEEDFFKISSMNRKERRTWLSHKRKSKKNK